MRVDLTFEEPGDPQKRWVETIEALSLLAAPAEALAHERRIRRSSPTARLVALTIDRDTIARIARAMRPRRSRT